MNFTRQQALEAIRRFENDKNYKREAQRGHNPRLGTDTYTYLLSKANKALAAGKYTLVMHIVPHGF